MALPQHCIYTVSGGYYCQSQNSNDNLIENFPSGSNSLIYQSGDITTLNNSIRDNLPSIPSGKGCPRSSIYMESKCHYVNSVYTNGFPPVNASNDSN